MANLAIKGHATRSNEVAEILKMLGAKDTVDYNFICSDRIYYVLHEGVYWEYFDPDIFDKYQIFTLEEFLKKYPYKVGDMVSVPEYESEVCIDDMRWVGFEIQYSVSADETESLYEWYSVEELNKCDEPHKEKIVEEKSVNHVYNVDDVDVISFDIAQKDIYELDLKDKFHVILRKGKYYVERIKPKYPTTYEECCKKLGYNQVMPTDHILGYKGTLLSFFQQLLICRDSYWKIAGEQMRLGKPWEQDYDDRCFIIRNDNGYVHTYEYHGSGNVILAFPTAEMRDTFYKNFKDLIESCKELL